MQIKSVVSSPMQWKDAEASLALQIPTFLPEVVRDGLGIRATSGPEKLLALYTLLIPAPFDSQT